MTEPSEAPIDYMARTRAYYLALGYETPYVWAHNEHIPFQRPGKPLAAMKIAIITTAAPYQAGKGNQGPGAAYNGAAKFFDPYRLPATSSPDVRISHIAYDRAHTEARDPRTWFPLEAARRAVTAGKVGSLTTHFYGAPTVRSQRTTVERDAPRILEFARQDKADAAVLVPNCPVCHQTVTLTARHLEANGISTVVMGCAKDIVEHAGAPRFVFSDFPLGNPAGRPFDEASQAQTFGLALDRLAEADKPGTTIQSPLKWPGPPGWKDDYSNPDKLSPEELARRREAFDSAKAAAAAN